VLVVVAVEVVEMQELEVLVEQEIHQLILCGLLQLQVTKPCSKRVVVVAGALLGEQIIFILLQLLLQLVELGVSP
jgi:hypothetical protein